MDPTQYPKNRFFSRSPSQLPPKTAVERQQQGDPPSDVDTYTLQQAFLDIQSLRTQVALLTENNAELRARICRLETGQPCETSAHDTQHLVKHTPHLETGGGWEDGAGAMPARHTYRSTSWIGSIWPSRNSSAASTSPISVVADIDKISYLDSGHASAVEDLWERVQQAFKQRSQNRILVRKGAQRSASTAVNVHLIFVSVRARKEEALKKLAGLSFGSTTMVVFVHSKRTPAIAGDQDVRRLLGTATASDICLQAPQYRLLVYDSAVGHITQFLRDVK
eukprot:m.171146 g.171146  ORF g.171146 m.171146 type:complete len:279 (-) comp18278_c0_seq4:469-1305(-)